MWATLLIALREGLEAALVVGIVLTVLRRLEQSRGRGAVWAGVGVAALLSLLLGLLLNAVGFALTGAGEQLFEGATMLLAAGVLTWMIFWMRRQGEKTQAGLEADVRHALAGGSRWALFALALVAVLREGVETALFLTAAFFGGDALQAWLGTALGLAAAVAVGVVVFAGSHRLNLQLFFRITSVLLLLFAAGLLSRGVHELQEARLLPVLVEHVYNLNPILDENGAVGTFLHTLFGYSGSPSLLETIVYAGYLVVVGFLDWRFGRPSKASSRVAKATCSQLADQPACES